MSGVDSMAAGSNSSGLRRGGFDVFAHHDFWRSATIIAVVLVLQLGGPLVAVLSYFGLCVWAFFGIRQSIESLTLSWLLAFLNPGIFESGFGEDVLRWIVIMAVFVRVGSAYFFSRRRVPYNWIALTLFVLVVSMTSLFTSYARDVSILKLTMFYLGSSSILLAFHATRGRVRYWDSWFLALFAVVVAAGLPLLFFPLGYVRNGWGFQGILNHPQAYALFLAPITARLTATVVLHQKRSLAMMALLSMGWISLLATRARTGFVALLMGLIVALVVVAVFRPAVRREILRVLMRPISLAFLLMLGGGLILNANLLQREIQAFLLKGDDDMTVAEAFQDSRGRLIERSWNNFERNPVLGIGFGVASDPTSFQIRRDPLFGLPVGASVEKGLLLTAILEEVGIVGSIFFGLMLFMILRPLLRRSPLPMIWMALTAICVNVGESVFFAVGGMGLFMWLIIGYAGVEA